MPYQRIKLSRQVKEQLRSWALPDDILKDVYIHLTEVLPKDPEHHLSRETSPFNGMVTRFTRRDAYTLGREHQFVFSVLFVYLVLRPIEWRTLRLGALASIGSAQQ